MYFAAYSDVRTVTNLACKGWLMRSLKFSKVDRARFVCSSGRMTNSHNLVLPPQAIYKYWVLPSEISNISTFNRTKSCIFGNKTCPSDVDEDLDDVYGLQHELFCNGPMTEVCPLAGSDFGDFRQFDIGGESRSLR